jgi:hypothetical protein
VIRSGLRGTDCEKLRYEGVQRTTQCPRFVHVSMRLLWVSIVVLGLAPIALASSSGRIISANGVRLTVPSGWQRLEAAPSGPVTDPRTLLVVGTAAVRPRVSQCQIAAYRIPASGAVVVAVGWKSAGSAGGAPKPGRAPLKKLVSVHRPSFECFSGRGAVAQVLLGGRPYQVNVMVGRSASKRRITEALAVARSFDTS